MVRGEVRQVVVKNELDIIPCLSDQYEKEDEGMFNEFPDMKVVERLRRLYPAGTRVILEKMEDPFTKLKPGEVGTVLYVDDAANVHINWDNGSSLAAIFGVDRIRRA